VFTLLQALGLESGALYLMLGFDTSTVKLAGFFALHGGASVLLAIAARQALPRAYRDPAAGTVALLASFAFFIPFLGMLGIAVAILLVMLMPGRYAPRPFAAVRAPEYSAPTEESPDRIRAGGLRTVLLDTDVAVELRMKSLVALQTLPLRTASPLLRRLLADPSDDLRLAAYAMLENEEKKIAAIITEEMERLERITEPAGRGNCLRRLAEQHWELVYTGLVQGDVQRHSLAAGLAYVDGALVLAAHEPGLWFLKGRLHQARGELDEAARGYAMAVACGIAETRVLPYLAEVLFEQRRFADVRTVMREIAATQKTPAMAPAIRFWCGEMAG
jgi:polysaccharide biosynthesis protein PelE